jgi:two-component system catabolic regulation response regulator CreB
MPEVLVVEDERAIADTILYTLRAEGMNPSHCMLGSEALALFRQRHFDVVILDVGLPDMNGLDVCREIRLEAHVPVLFLTARGSEVDRVVGLQLGADDYVVKPFSPRALAARVRGILRRSAWQESIAPHPSAGRVGAEQAGCLAVDERTLRIERCGVELDLTRYGYLLLKALTERPGESFLVNS